MHGATRRQSEHPAALLEVQRLVARPPGQGVGRRLDVDRVAQGHVVVGLEVAHQAVVTAVGLRGEGGLGEERRSGSILGAVGLMSLMGLLLALRAWRGVAEAGQRQVTQYEEEVEAAFSEVSLCALEDNRTSDRVERAEVLTS